MRRFTCASHSRHPTASQRCTSSAPKDHAGAWADELVLDTHVASMTLHGRSSKASSVLSLHDVVSIDALVSMFKWGIVLNDTDLTLRRLTLFPPLSPFADIHDLWRGPRMTIWSHQWWSSPRPSVSSCFVKSTPPFSAYTAWSMSLTIFLLDSSTFVSRTVQWSRIVARISFTLLRRASTSKRNYDTMSQTVLIDASRSSFASFHSLREWNPVRFHRFLCLFVYVMGFWRCISTSMITIVFMYYIHGALMVFCTFWLIGTCCMHHLIRNCTCGNSTVFFLDRLSTLD